VRPLMRSTLVAPEIVKALKPVVPIRSHRVWPKALDSLPESVTNRHSREVPSSMTISEKPLSGALASQVEYGST